jgi:diadenosine tetraphosphate (Ap4A) HIT family hydrolase
MSVKNLECPFCAPAADRIVAENRWVMALSDGFPVSLGHTLVIPKRHIASLDDISTKERSAIWSLVAKVRRLILERHRPDGFNIGVNDGIAAGQTVMHLHVHVIPRYSGDQKDPRGGVRWVLPGQANYWDVQ